jgi:amino acid adenylation domain-containing protein
MSTKTKLNASPIFSEIDAPRTLVDLLRRRALEQPAQVGYTFLIDGELESVALTYAELDQQARSIGAWLQQMVSPGDRVLLLYPPGLEYVAAFFGCLYAGAVAVPAYPPRPNRSLLRLQTIVADAGATVAITTAPILSRVVPFFAKNPYLEPLRWLTTDSLESSAQNEWNESAVTTDTIAFLQYTSGSTGAPKGVILTHGNLLHNAKVVYHMCGHGPNERYLSWLPTFHDMGFMAGILQPLYGGFPVISMSPTAFLQRPLRWLEAITRYKATTSGGPNFAYDLCLRKVNAEQRAALDLSSWTVAFNGAEPIRQETLDRFAATFGECGFRAETMYPCYGLAEATLMVTGSRKHERPVIKQFQVAPLESHVVVENSSVDEDTRPVVGCGSWTTVLDQKVTIVNPQTLVACAPEEVGEIWVGSPSVSPGYWNRIEETSEIFNAYISPANEGPYLRTGDLGFIRDGELFVTGRLKDLIIIRGLNHYPQDIEWTVEQCHPELRPGCGAAFSIEVAGEERLAIVQEVNQHHQADLDAVIERICEVVAEQHEVQVHAVVLIKHGQILKTSSGKIQRHACRIGLLERSLDVLAEWRANIPTRVEAQTPSALLPEAAEEIELWLRAQLAGRLGVPESTIDLHQPIARYGIDSLMAIELMHAVETSLSVSLSVVNFLQSPSLADIAAHARTQLLAPVAHRRPVAATQQESGTSIVEHPLSYGQRALWFLHQLAPESAAYNIASAVRIPAEVDTTALHRAWQALVERHPSLRTTFTARSGEPVLRTHPHTEVHFQQHDASSWSEESLRSTLTEQAHMAFDLENGPLLRVSLFTRAPQEYVLLLCVHHIVADFWSLAVLISELGTLYEAEKTSTPASLTHIELQHSDYTRWQNEMLASAEGESLWDFWREQLAGELPLLTLPTDRPRPTLQHYRGASHTFSLSKDLTAALKALGPTHGTTLYMTLLAAFELLLYRHTGQAEILVGSVTAGRNWAALKNSVGYFVNPIVLRGDLSGDPGWEVLLARVRQNVLEAFAHQDYPFPLLVERLQPEREAGRSPIFQVMFLLQQSHLLKEEGLASFALGEAGARLQLGSLPLESMALDQRVSQFDLTLMMAEVNGGLTGSLQYDTDLFDATTIEQLASRFGKLLESLVSNPQQKLSEAQLLTDEDRCLLAEVNETSAVCRRGVTMSQLFEEQVESTPEAIALTFENESVTYTELNRRSNQLAHYLQSLGVGPEVLVGVLLERSVDLIVTLLGILKAGSAYVPLDPQYPSERLGFILEDGGIQVLLTHERLLGLLPVSDVRTVCVDRDCEAIAAQGKTFNPETEVREHNLAYIIYTSGSTGRPKGVAIEHRSAVTFISWAAGVFGPEVLGGVLGSTSICFDLSVFEIFVPLTQGGKVILVKNALHLPLVPATQVVTLINTVPSAITELLRINAIPPSVKVVNLAGEALQSQLVQELYRQKTVEQVFNLYGPSEDTTYSTYTLCKNSSEAPTIGRPVANTQAYILNAGLEPVPVGVIGELYLGGDGLARGYLARPELTAERFLPDSFGWREGGRLYRTGDLARLLPNGEIEFLGRGDQQIKLRGYRIELGEVEASLCELKGVRQAVALIKKDERGGKRLVAFVKADAGVSGHELRQVLRAKLPEYMVPQTVALTEEMPLLPNGKIDRARLAEAQIDTDAVVESTSAPRTAVEEMVCGIWMEVLGVEQVGIEDDFFELGGHSLLATQVMSRVREVFGVEVPLRHLFESHTVANLAKAIETLKSDGAKSLDEPIPKIHRETYRIRVSRQKVMA